MRSVFQTTLTRTLSSLLTLTLVLWGCSGDSGTDPGGGGTPPPSPDFGMTLSAGTLSINQGGSGSVTVTITRTGGFAASVGVAVEGLPQGVTAGALTIASGSTSGTLTLTATSGAQTGAASLTVRGTGTGIQPKTAALALTVNAVAQPDFTIALSPGSLSVKAGEGGTSTVTITRTGGFAGSVALSISGLPAGVAGSFNPAATTGASSTLTLTTEAALPALVTEPGTYPLTVTGTAEGVGAREASFSLEVTAPDPPPPPGGNISWEFCAASGLPEWVAVQDGEGPWARVTGTGGVHSFDLDSEKGGVAWVYPDGTGGFTLEIFYGSKEEVTVYGADRCGGQPGAGKTVTASVPGLGATDITILSLGGKLPVSAPTMAGPNITFEGVRTGSVDLLGGRSALDLGTLSIVPQRFLIQRGLNPANGSSLGTIDFNGEFGFAPVSSPLTVTNTGGLSVLTTVNYSTGGITFGNLAVGIGGSTWFGVPASRQQANELHILTVTAASLSQPLQPSQTTVRMIREAGAVTVNLGPQLSAPTVQPLAGVGHARARADYPIQPEYHRFWLANFQQAGPFRAATIQVTRAYRGSSTGTVGIEIPEFDGVDGWDAQWGLRVGGQVTWTVSALGWTDAGGIAFAPFVDGNSYESASRMGQFTP